jgi:tetratricopeptide (TPR) repeat protein
MMMPLFQRFSGVSRTARNLFSTTPFSNWCSTTLIGVAVCAGGVVQAQQSAFTSPADRDAAARSAYARGDTSRVNSSLTEAVRTNPFDPVALNNLAVNYAASGDYQNAVALLERAQRIAPNRVDIVNNLANLKAWMVQDSQFAVGTRGSPQALNFPRAEDTPPELPPLWAGPPPTYPQAAAAAPAQPVQPSIRPPVVTYQAAPSYAQPAYAAQPTAPAPPVAYQQAPGYAPPSPTSVAASGSQAPATAYVKASKPAMTTRPEYVARASTPRQTMITERAIDNISKKRKRPQALDCPVP